jgi:hypothetical protein
MRARQHAVSIGFALALLAAPGAADDEPAGPITEVIAVEVDTLPMGQLPALPLEADAPSVAAAWSEAETITVTAAGETSRPRHHRKPFVSVSKKSIAPQSIAAKRAEKVKLVSIAPTSPSLDALYVLSSDSSELEGQPVQKMSCGDSASVLPMRWEAFTTAENGDARLSVRDLWFYAKACAVGPGPATIIPLKAIAWDGGKPWLYAMRSHGSVTLVMPRANEVNTESMVGVPVSMRGAFTRISMPLGRWGSGSIMAQLDSLASEPAGEGDDRPVEVGIELVQTMSEKAPTLLVRTRRAGAVPASDEARD